MYKKSVYCRFKNVESAIELWHKMDDIVWRLRDKKILRFWKKNSTPMNIKYSELVVNPYFYTKEFECCDYDRIWKIFVHCMCMSVDQDIPEYLNCLEVIGE